jgi:hypothetical protein
LSLSLPSNAALWRQIPPRDRYARAALGALPRLVGLMDKNPFSPSFGSFDRSYWHYRTMDFPCGMSQEMVLPLALAYAWDMPGGEAYRGSERLRELVLGSMHFARKSSHSDGTCDDYFPFERAMGALVFSLHAMTESCLALGLDKAARPSDDYGQLLEFFARRGEHLGRKNETGQLANHQALAALALYNVYLVTKDEKFRKFSDERLALTLSWQTDEGWFQEYEGADPGYHSCSIAFLAKLWLKSQDERILKALKPAVEFAWHFQHPDGSYAGEYGSRNTYHFYPHGFEVMVAQGDDRARWIADMFLHRGLPDGTRYFNDDDRMAAHYVCDWMQSWRDFAPRPDNAPEPEPAPPVRRYFPKAGLAVRREEGVHVIANLRKGGVFKAISPEGAFASDTGPMLRLRDGTTLVSHMMDAAKERSIDEVAGEWRAAKGVFHRRKHRLATPWTQIAFRLMTLTLGRFAPNLVRAVLQKVLITGKKGSEFRFERTLQFGPEGLQVVDLLSAEGAPPLGTDREVTEAAFGCDATSIYVANSNTFQRSVLLLWTRIEPEHLRELNETGRVQIVRAISWPRPGEGRG